MRLRYFLLLLFSVGEVSLPAAQEDRRQHVLARGVLRVGTTGDYQPFSYRANALSPFIGLEIELAGSLARALGVKLELVATTWPTLMEDLAADRFDVAMSGVSISADRARLALFSIPYLQDGKTPIARCEDQGRFQTLEQIDQPGVRVVVNPGGTNERFARANFRRATVALWPDNVSIFDRIVERHADVMITDAIETRLQQRLRPQLCAIHPEAPFTRSEKAYLLPRDERWKAAIDEWLQPFLTSGEFTRRLEKWLEHPWPRGTAAAIDLKPVTALIEQRLALMPHVARHKWNHQAAIEDVERERQIITGLRQEAELLGIPGPWAERFFRAQIEAAKIVQRELFTQWRRQQQPRFDDVPDLATVIRPQLDALTPELLRALARAWPALSDPAQQTRIAATVQGVRSRDGVNPTAIAQATQPLLVEGADRRRP